MNPTVLRTALENLLEHYVSLAKSGVAGNWDPETEAPVIFARQVLKPPDGPTFCLGMLTTGECTCGLGAGHAGKL